MEVGLGPGDFLLDGDPAPNHKRGGAPPNFRLLWPNGCMDQDATWYGATLCSMWTQLPQKKGHTRPMQRHRPTRRPRPTWHGVRCGPSYPQKKGHIHPHPIFGPCLLWPNGWMDLDAAWYGSRPRPRPHCTRRSPSSHKRGTAAPSFRPRSIVATVTHLSYCWALVAGMKVGCVWVVRTLYRSL